ncbi:glycosyltransferase family 1 protein [bacterium]|nr:glycosyltransferase family 1 protein [bacterium]
MVAPGEAGCSHSTFEVAATGTFLLQRDRPDLHLLYEKSELATFDGTFLDLKKKIDYYLKHREEREEIAEKAYQRTIREHLYKHRFKRVLKELGFES